SSHGVSAERLDEADALARDALHWATVSDDAWEIAEAARDLAVAASTLSELRASVEMAASLLTQVGNVRQLAGLLTSAAYAALCLDGERDAAVFAARAAPLARTLPGRFEEMINCGNAGLAALLTGESGAAAQGFHDELVLCRELVVRPMVFEGLRGMAALAVLDGDDERAATLVGAAEAHRYDNADDAVHARLDRAFFAPARARCDASWDAAAADGS